jgi:hypothetical protein
MYALYADPAGPCLTRMAVWGPPVPDAGAGPPVGRKPVSGAGAKG